VQPEQERAPPEPVQVPRAREPGPPEREPERQVRVLERTALEQARAPKDSVPASSHRSRGQSERAQAPEWPERAAASVP
jgi:hypothetical protein